MGTMLIVVFADRDIGASSGLDGNAARRTGDRFSLIGLHRLQDRIDQRRADRTGRVMKLIIDVLIFRDEVVRCRIAQGL